MSVSWWSVWSGILFFARTPNYKMGARGGAAWKPQMFGANQLQWIVRHGDEGSDLVHSNLPWKVLKWRAWLETNGKARFKGCKWWWKILIRHLRQLAKLLVFPKCWSVSCSVSLQLKVLKKGSFLKPSWNSRDGEFKRWPQMHSLGMKYPIPENKMKTRREKRRKWTYVCPRVLPQPRPPQGPVSFIRNGPLPLLQVPTAGYSEATWTGFDPPGEVFMIANLAKRFFSLPSNISFHLQPQGRALAFPLEPGI